MIQTTTAILDRLRDREPLEQVTRERPIDNTRKKRQFSFWNAEIQRARTKLRRDQREEDWARYRDIQAYLGDYSDYNFVAPPITDRVDEIMGERPDVMIEVLHKGQERHLSALEAMEANDSERSGYWREAKRIVSDSAWLGIGWGKQEWLVTGLPSTPGVQRMNAAIERQQLSEIAQEHMVMAQYLQPMAIQAADVHWLHLELHRQELVKALNLEHLQALEGHIEQHEALVMDLEPSASRLVRVRPEDMIFDPDAREWDSIQWCAEHTVEILEDVLGNPDYVTARSEASFIKKYERLDAEPGDLDSASVEHNESLDDGDSGGLRIVHVYRIYDRRGGPVWNAPDYHGPRLIFFSPEQTDKVPLNVVAWPYRGCIHQPLVLNPVKDQIEGVSMCDQIQHVDRKLRLFTDAMVSAVEKAPKDRGFISGTLFSNEREKSSFLKAEVDWTITKGQLSPTDIFQFKHNTVNPDLFQANAILQAYINRTLRSAEVTQGVEGGAKFATEIDALVAARGRGVREFQEIVSVWLGLMRKLFFAQMHDFATPEIVASAAGGVAMGGDVLGPEEIPLDLVVKVDVDSFSAFNRELHKKQLREFLQFLFVETAGSLLSMITPDGITEILVRALRLNGFKEPEKFVVTLDQQSKSVMVQMMAGAPQAPGPMGTPPLEQPMVQSTGEMMGAMAQV